MTDDKIGNSIKITRDANVEAPLRNYLGLSPIKTEGELCLVDPDYVAPKKKIKSKKKLRKRIAKLEAELENKELYKNMWHKARAYAEGLDTALRAVLIDIADYERANNLCPNPGKQDCWQSVAAARAALEGK